MDSIGLDWIARPQDGATLIKLKLLKVESRLCVFQFVCGGLQVFGASDA
jgi:hypothetical protein